MQMQLEEMKAKFSLVTLLLLALLVAACSSGEVEPTANDDGATSDENNALTEIDVTEDAIIDDVPEVDSSGPASLPVAEQAGEEGDDAAQPNAPNSEGEAVSPVTVNLSDITPDAEGDGENVVQPAPGVPDLGVKMANTAMQELAKRLNIDMSELDVTLIEEREWSDGSLGCPQEGYMYTQALVPGYYILLTTGDTEYAFHTDSGNLAILCVDGAPAP